MNDKELLKLIKTRRSIRKFTNIPIPKKDLMELVEAGIYAPSGSNTQCYRFIVITNKEDIDFLAKHKFRPIETATAVIVVVADLDKCNYLKGNRKEEFDKLPYQDCSMAIQNILLLATAKGIGNCVIHLSKNIRYNNEIMERFNLTTNYELMGLIMLGYSDEIINYNRATHAGKFIKRKSPKTYIIGGKK